MTINDLRAEMNAAASEVNRVLDNAPADRRELQKEAIRLYGLLTKTVENGKYSTLPDDDPARRNLTAASRRLLKEVFGIEP